MHIKNALSDWVGRRAGRSLSLRARLAGGAALLAAGTLLTALTLYLGMTRVADRLDTALQAEARMARYATLSTQVSTFLVIATEAVQSGLDPLARADRVAPVVDDLRDTFLALRADLEVAVARAESLGLDAQSRHATQSLGLARMEALLNSAVTGLSSPTDDRDRLRAEINTFASSFDPLLNHAVNSEALFRNRSLAQIDQLRGSLSRAAVAIALLSLVLALVFYVGLIRPQFGRLDRLRDAARQIGHEDFSVSLPDTQDDEIGQLYTETNRMARALSLREARLREDRAQLSQTIDTRTRELRAANSELARIDENRRRFFADVSHELRTPLTVILMEAQLGRKGMPDPEAAFATIEVRAARLNRRIDDLLRVSRSDSGVLELDPVPLALGPLLDEVVEDVAAEVATAGLNLTCDPVPSCTMLRADPNWLRQVLAGLVRNAVRHARAGGQVRLAPLPDGTGAAVIDNGPGIPAAVQPRIFDRFARAGSAKDKGFGIGLALAKWVVEEHGGSIAVQSPVPRDTALGQAPGTKVSVRLPVPNA
jgi:hypothetical protein